MDYFLRYIETSLLESLMNFPVTAITGPRQCGKSNLVKRLINGDILRKTKRRSRALEKLLSGLVYLDLERPSDLRKLDNAEWFLGSQKGKLVCIDEIQRKPELFPLIRSLVDEWDRSGCFLILGSASRDLLKQSSESLAGRVSYKRLTPFLWGEIEGKYSMERYFSAGGFPRSILVNDRKVSYQWREDFISTFLERDLLQWREFTPKAMGRLWRMLAHINGQTVNYSTLASSLGISSVSVKKHIDLLASTYMVEVVSPWFSNLNKRLVKAPKVYIADSGITAALLGLRSFDELSGHPVFGAVWEQIVFTNLRGWYPNAEICYYRTSNGAEADFVINIDGKIYAIECKVSFSPVLSKGNYLAFEDIAPKRTFIVTPSPDSWSFKPGIDVVSLGALRKKLAS
ncbi:MAG: ATP-binding protein [Treponema sp.]|jgi:predicted AAA+ superfamily ATPase|nr:ATP-binding protein [Treponema sp.]